MAYACAASPARDVVPEPEIASGTVEPTAEPEEPAPDRGTIVAMDESELIEGAELDRRAQGFQAQLEAVFLRLSDQLDACYLPQLKRNPSLSGQITVHMTVVAGGKLGAGPTITESTLENATVEQCVLGIVSSQRYPEPFNDEFTEITRVFAFGEF